MHNNTEGGYIHPLIIDNTRYLLNKNPFEFCEEVSEEYFPDLVEQRTINYMYEDFLLEKDPNEQTAREQARRDTAVEVLKSDDFLKWFKDAGYDAKVDTEQFRCSPREEEYEGR